MYYHKTVNAETGEETLIEFSQDEIKVMEANIAKANAEIAEAEKKAAAKDSALAKLAALGLTSEEISAIS
jgi:hypothetical protein